MQIKNEFLLRWLDFTKGSESADSHFAWSGMSCVSACLGTRSVMRYGRIKFTPNMYVILTGPAALRKSSAAKVGVNILREYTNIKFGPDDTNGMRQGLFSAFQDAYGDNPDINVIEVAEDDDVTNALSASFDPLEQLVARHAKKKELQKKQKRKIADDAPRDLFVFADELASFIGMNQSELINCLSRLYYTQKVYEYKLSNSTNKLKNPCLGMLACTTPASLVKHLPEHSLGEGFSSRVMFVYAPVNDKKVFMPPELCTDERNRFGLLFERISNVTTEFYHSPAALRVHEQIYNDYIPDIPDTRFTDYIPRRNEHMAKVMMALCAGDERNELTVDDVFDAHMLLCDAEELMTNALGELGLNRSSLCKQNMRDMIEHSFPAGVAMSVLQASAMRDMKTKQEFRDAINDFVAKKICIVETVKNKNGNDYEVVLPIRDNMKKKNKLERSHFEKKYNNEGKTNILL